jgi:hypothetical protein
VEWTGIATGEQAQALVAQLAPGAPYHGLPLLISLLKMESMEPGARTAFGGRTETPSTEWIALVNTNPVTRGATKLITRMNRHERQQMFATEDEALAWLDERAREDAEAAKA